LEYSVLDIGCEVIRPAPCIRNSGLCIGSKDGSFFFADRYRRDDGNGVDGDNVKGEGMMSVTGNGSDGEDGCNAVNAGMGGHDGVDDVGLKIRGISVGSVPLISICLIGISREVIDRTLTGERSAVGSNRIHGNDRNIGNGRRGADQRSSIAGKGSGNGIVPGMNGRMNGNKSRISDIGSEVRRSCPAVGRSPDGRSTKVNVCSLTLSEGRNNVDGGNRNHSQGGRTCGRTGMISGINISYGNVINSAIGWKH
jgi:hypothetical protein